MLDHTQIVWINELGKGNSHTLSNIPFMFIGGGPDSKQLGLSISKESHTIGFGYHSPTEWGIPTCKNSSTALQCRRPAVIELARPPCWAQTPSPISDAFESRERWNPVRETRRLLFWNRLTPDRGKSQTRHPPSGIRVRDSISCLNFISLSARPTARGS